MSGKRFAGVSCTLCGVRESSRLGEHVWPRWLLSEFPVSDGPYRIDVGGEPVRTRAGAVREYVSMQTVQMPCCKTCNDVLNKRFEQQMNELVLAALNWPAIIEPEDAVRLGLWWLKTMLLLSHPSAEDSAVGTSPPRWDVEQTQDDLYSWMVTGGQPPKDLTVWAARRSADAVPEPERRPNMYLPTIVADGRMTAFMVRQVALKDFEVTLLYHPGWPVEHPLEVSGEVVRIWPAPPGGLDLGALRGVTPWLTRWLPGPTLQFFDGAYERKSLPPLLDLGFGHTVPGVRAAWQ